MMRIDPKRLNEVSQRAAERLARAESLSRRQRALLAAAGEEAPERRWYVLTIDPGEDNAVDNVLENAGIEHWMPALTVKAKRRGKRKWQRFCPLVTAAFPGYILVRVAWSEVVWTALAGVSGVSGIVGGAFCPAPLKDKEVMRFRARVEKDPAFIEILTNALKVGDHVRIEDGLFESVIGVVRALSGRGRAKVDVDIFGRETSLHLDLAQVSKLD